jgi:hypothetical protein
VVDKLTEQEPDYTQGIRENPVGDTLAMILIDSFLVQLVLTAWSISRVFQVSAMMGGLFEEVVFDFVAGKGDA